MGVGTRDLKIIIFLKLTVIHKHIQSFKMVYMVKWWLKQFFFGEKAIFCILWICGQSYGHCICILIGFQVQLQLVDGPDPALPKMHDKRAPLWLTGWSCMHVLLIAYRRGRSSRTYRFAVCKSIQSRTFLTKRLRFFYVVLLNIGYIKGSHIFKQAVS